MTQANLEKRDDRSLSPKPDEILLFSCVRNERARLPYFIQYYRALGVERFLFIDNASNDGSLEFLLAQPNTHVFYTGGSYAKRSGPQKLDSVLSGTLRIDYAASYSCSC